MHVRGGLVPGDRVASGKAGEAPLDATRGVGGERVRAVGAMEELDGRAAGAIADREEGLGRSVDRRVRRRDDGRVPPAPLPPAPHWCAATVKLPYPLSSRKSTWVNGEAGLSRYWLPPFGVVSPKSR